MLSGELVNRNSREEPVCFEMRRWARFQERRSSFACVEGRARPSEQLGSSSWTVGVRLLVLKGEFVNEICREVIRATVG